MAFEHPNHFPVVTSLIMSRTSLSVPLPAMRHFLVHFLTMCLLPMTGAFDISVNTNVSRRSAVIFSFSCSVSVGRVSSDLSVPFIFQLNASWHFRYWGQNSYGATNPSDTANWQQPISYYCQVRYKPFFFLCLSTLRRK